MEEELNAMVTMERDLKAAISNNELYLHYQPLVDKTSHKILGVEALCRWKSPNGNISPAQFIPIAENNGLIHKIGKWVLKEALKTLRAWQENYSPDIYLSVNVSPAQFQNKYFGKEYRRMIRSSGVDPRGIILEITETAAITDTDACCRQLAHLTNLGVQIALDDFGSGHSSSLSLLKRLPLNWVKVDKSLINKIHHQDADYSKVHDVLDYCNTLGYRVIIEGIEHQAQIKKLHTLNFDLIQGFAFYEPLAKQDVENHLGV